MSFKCDKQCPTCKYGEYIGVDVKQQGKTIYGHLKFACHYLDVKTVKMLIEAHK